MLKSYKFFLIIAILSVVVVVLFLLRPRPRPRALKWFVCYSADIKAGDVGDADWAIVDAKIDPKLLANGHTKFIAYLSVGEAEEYRDYWLKIKDSGAVVEQNPDWAGNYLIDIRSAVWQKILLDEALPKIMADGFDGVFLDTLDTALYLEEREPEKFFGSRLSLVNFVREIRQRYPHFLIVPNNALEVLPDYADLVDAALVEDLYTRYDFNLKKSITTPLNVSLLKETLLDAFHKSTGKPVLNILYAAGLEDPIAKEAIERSRKKGYGWYLSNVDLMKVGVMNP